MVASHAAAGLALAGRHATGRDPREMTRAELHALGHQPMSPLRALRQRCLDCCADQPSEVRKCTAVRCPSWPYRMATNPWRETTEAQREARRESGRRLAARTTSPPKNPIPLVAGAGDDSPLAGSAVAGQEREVRDARPTA